ncbi:putative Long-chain-fatty-acid--CoA ligase [Vibrio nigripulchritudo SFn27]|uniref:Putative Long-chain-fatty-acid--CoA ligase n=1 Tax=Vibrio nigripulchritudo TaxID=28173 RepID=U4KD29_9VIBR|nr:AMP-binding protein [Vibrio nigripulchritudo]CCN83144.1 putative Long-chain-fatty-acid--CoA ligase [Vibrio nigripulchritudo BLFn1]CCN86252.1 putative Long-chain-fatty-acid--CoA ligase [Vibrio nigripulchritudo SFn27]CCN92812.1 putative Long-chain-fatty-acid--CoA ligase [Vibrio nigripulchritudo ENn2]CCO42752.1 putative Long-chain-fatty-acid--CoA ligase [Vibrio nigripulchritudo SFn135]CCO52619.1 putative Long-chain-fatty-acid--CoA ligase [Vibrio nigripulchritudo Wn13]
MVQPQSTQNVKCSLTPPNELILKWAEERPNDVYLKQIINRQFVEFTYADVADKALKLVSALQGLGLNPGDKVALISKNCAEWFITDLALMLGDYISVPIFPTAGSDTIEHCITHSGSKALIAGKLDDSAATTEVINKLSDLITISLPYDSAPNCQHAFTSLIENQSPSELRPEHYDDKLMSIVYTSGTSGLPKGAMLTYGAFNWSSQKLIEHLGVDSDGNDRLMSYLPLAHITERVYIFGTSIREGVQTAFPESLDTFIEDVKMQRPTLFISVPRLWTVFQQRIQEKLPQKKLNILLKIPFINSLIKKKLANGLGLNEARILGCGSAPVSPALLEWYRSVGLNITEAWGMTESFAYSTLNYPFRPEKIGTVGNAGPGIEIKIADDEEILVRSKGMFAGYYKNDEATQESFNEDGWLHTGDIGSLDNEGYLTIQGRKKDTFKTAKGKFVAPVPIEKKLFEYSKVEMMCLIGSGLPGPILLAIPHAYPNFDRARYERRAVKVVERMNQTLESHEQIKGVLMVKEPWSIENGVLTPTLKIKRHVLEKKYHDIGANWPKGQMVVWED